MGKVSKIDDITSFKLLVAAALISARPIKGFPGWHK
jgi:hypothetical protein